jgi:hypothetical protein
MPVVGRQEIDKSVTAITLTEPLEFVAAPTVVSLVRRTALGVALDLD